MRGGAIPLLAWGTILFVLYAIHAVWDGRTVPTLATAFAVLAIYGAGVALWLARRDALHRGPPPPETAPTAAPSSSLAALVAGLSVTCILFGLVWSSFLILFGAGMLVISLGRLAIEVRSERQSERQAAEEQAPR